MITFCPAGWEANISYEINCRKQGDIKFFLFQKELRDMLMTRQTTFYMPLTLTNYSAYENKSQQTFQSTPNTLLFMSYIINIQVNLFY